jgi:hypothetical protein
MALFNSQHHSCRGMRWLGTAATAVAELLVVVVVGVAVVRYLEWSSDANLAEFMSRGQAIGVCCKSFRRIFNSDSGLKGRADT